MQDQFKQFYINKHQNRRLMWQNSQGHCLVHARFPKVGAVLLRLSSALEAPFFFGATPHVQVLLYLLYHRQGAKDLQLSLYQAVVIMLFNQHKILTFNQILQMTAIRKCMCLYCVVSRVCIVVRHVWEVGLVLKHYQPQLSFLSARNDAVLMSLTPPRSKMLFYPELSADDELKRTLQSMAMGKVRVMAKNPKARLQSF